MAAFFNIPMKSFSLLLITIFLYTARAFADSSFDQWLLSLKAEAQRQGISRSVLEQAFQGVTPLPKVLELDRKQPESTMTFEEYKRYIVSPQRIAQGRRMMQQHRDLLREVGQYYGVQPRFIVALWGIETSYGNNIGDFNVIEALTTLAYDGRRSDFFRGELLDALRILQEGHISLSEMKGSWAGAMGQSQFMPSSFLRLAVDFNRDGRKDIWTTLPDVFASAANYLSQSGWHGDEIWGREVSLPPGFNPDEAGLHIRKPLQTWQKLGIRRIDGRDLPAVSMKGAIIFPNETISPAYLVYHNFGVLMKWNRSTYFATSVGLLADALVH